MNRFLREKAPNRTILCVDDTPLILQLYRRIFEEKGYEVLVASSGREGLDAIKRHPVDCIILDFQMPGMDGAEVIRRMNRDETSPPVILVSGSDPPWELLSHVDAFVEKPFLITELVDRVEGVLGLRTVKDQEQPSGTATPIQESNAYSAN